MPTRALKKSPKSFALDKALKDYAVLRKRVEEVLIRGRQRMEREFMLLRYQTGLLINEHVRLNEGRAAYGAQAILKLEKDFDIDHTELQRYAQFARAYPISGGRRKLEFNLPWIHYRKLMIISNDELRYELTAQAEKNQWSFEEVEGRVQYAVGKVRDEKEAGRLPPVCLGPFFTYKIIRAGSSRSDAKELLLDMGFQYRLEMKALGSKAARFREEAIVMAAEGFLGGSALTKAEGVNDDSLYTYKARVESVVDGDTLKLDFFLGLGCRKGETIRLNHINCPEMNTPEGVAAKRFVESVLKDCEFITVKSVRTKKEKWGRYLADVFLPVRDAKISTGGTRGIGNEYQKKGSPAPVYLNQLLLDKGYAVRVRT